MPTQWFAEEKVLKDPIHDWIYIKDPLIWNLINTRAFQRLRRIKQLGTSYLVFHGSEHSRLTHSLGTYETMRKLLSHFHRNHGWPDEERVEKLALCAALLHDIGHGPFSHSFETAFQTHHENWTQRILMEDSEVNGILRSVDEQFPQDVAGIIAKDSKYPLLVQIISSQLDVDRMDYLLRDAFNTGVIYGKYELERLIRVMRPYENDIVIKSSGIHTVEQYVLARYFMYTQVYLHHKTVGSDLLLRSVMLRAKALFGKGLLQYHPVELVPFFSKRESDIQVSEYLSLDESIMLHAFQRWRSESDPILADLASRFLDRRLFASVACDKQTEDSLQEMRDAFQATGLDPHYYLIYQEIATGGFLYKEGIRVIDEQGMLREIHEVSHLINSLVPEIRYRLYYPKDAITADGEFASLYDRLQQLKTGN
ncbi:HD domain-containing protein [Effusibacillus dendaii]|uniref:HD domain-containing protein n=1 Tax=Effusibacillus dendaii TaxID=2743772 RepID=A0A7I8DB00_9BACL|nr:HD domain-containing protein [Effusibacillus dendaii]BCJ86522.1 HD domain-containing protein [Effusibacillus dendaii]